MKMIKEKIIIISLLLVSCGGQFKETEHRAMPGNWRCDDNQFKSATRDYNWCMNGEYYNAGSCLKFAKQANCDYIGFIAPKETECQK